MLALGHVWGFPPILQIWMSRHMRNAPRDAHTLHLVASTRAPPWHHTVYFVAVGGVHFIVVAYLQGRVHMRSLFVRHLDLAAPTQRAPRHSRSAFGDFNFGVCSERAVFFEPMRHHIRTGSQLVASRPCLGLSSCQGHVDNQCCAPAFPSHCEFRQTRNTLERPHDGSRDIRDSRGCTNGRGCTFAKMGSRSSVFMHQPDFTTSTHGFRDFRALRFTFVRLEFVHGNLFFEPMCHRIRTRPFSVASRF